MVSGIGQFPYALCAIDAYALRCAFWRFILLCLKIAYQSNRSDNDVLLSWACSAHPHSIFSLKANGAEVRSLPRQDAQFDGGVDHSDDALFDTCALTMSIH